MLYYIVLVAQHLNHCAIAVPPRESKTHDSYENSQTYIWRGQEKLWL